MEDTKGKITKLPTWVQKHIDNLETQLCHARQKVSTLERRIQVLTGRIDVMVDIFTSAARAENETAQAYVDRIASQYAEDEV